MRLFETSRILSAVSVSNPCNVKASVEHNTAQLPCRRALASKLEHMSTARCASRPALDQIMHQARPVLTSMALMPLWLRYSSCSAVQADSPAMDSRRLLSRASRCRFVSLWRDQDSRSSMTQPYATHRCPPRPTYPCKQGAVHLLPLCLCTACTWDSRRSLGHAVQRRQTVAPEPQLPQASKASNGPQLTQPVGAQLQQCQRCEVANALGLRAKLPC